jgi:hypothetical protein
MLLRHVTAFFLSFAGEIKTAYFRFLSVIPKSYPPEISIK